MKRKSQGNDDDLTQQQSKKQKSSDKNEDRFSTLPPELLLEIVKKMNPGLGQIKALSETCTTFNDLCLPRLVLHLDFNRIKDEEEYPVVHRAYNEVNISGAEVDEYSKKIKETLRSSRYTATKLFIGSYEPDVTQKCVITQRVLMSVLKALPNVTELTMENIKAKKPFTSFTAIKDNEYPRLRNLTDLHLYNCSDSAISALKHASNLEKLRVCIENEVPSSRKYSALVAQQRGLETLRINCYHDFHLKAGTFPSLKTFEGPDEQFFLNTDIFEIAPNVENIKLIFPGLIRTEDSFLMQNESVYLKTFETQAYVDLDIFSIRDIRNNYPSLESFKSANLEWRKLT